MEHIDDDYRQKAVMADLFESSFIEMVCNLAVKQKIKKGDFANRVWPDSSEHVARNKWANMRIKAPGTGKPATCSLSDAFRLASALGLNMAYVVLQAENLAENKLKEISQPAADISAKPKAARKMTGQIKSDGGEIKKPKSKKSQ